MSDTSAMWIALAACVAALVVVTWTTFRAHRQWARTRLTQRAALALIDTHRDRIDGGIDLVAEQAGSLADDGEHLAELLSELRADVEQLRWIFEQIPDAQTALKRELYDLLLPTESSDRERHETHA